MIFVSDFKYDVYDDHFFRSLAGGKIMFLSYHTHHNPLPIECHVANPIRETTQDESDRLFVQYYDRHMGPSCLISPRNLWEHTQHYNINTPKTWFQTQHIVEKYGQK